MVLDQKYMWDELYNYKREHGFPMDLPLPSDERRRLLPSKTRKSVLFRGFRNQYLRMGAGLEEVEVMLEELQKRLDELKLMAEIEGLENGNASMMAAASAQVILSVLQGDITDPCGPSLNDQLKAVGEARKWLDRSKKLGRPPSSGEVIEGELLMSEGRRLLRERGRLRLGRGGDG